MLHLRGELPPNEPTVQAVHRAARSAISKRAASRVSVVETNATERPFSVGTKVKVRYRAKDAPAGVGARAPPPTLPLFLLLVPLITCVA